MDSVLTDIDTSTWSDDDVLTACIDRGVEVPDGADRRTLDRLLHGDVAAKAVAFEGWRERVETGAFSVPVTVDETGALPVTVDETGAPPPVADPPASNDSMPPAE